MTLILNPATQKRIDAYLHDMPHALLITGPHGVGASTIALDMASKLTRTVMTVLPERDEQVDLEKGTITVALIRRLYEQTRTKADRRIIVIDYAQRMATAAQNAFLKLLEEPTDGVTFLLVTHEPQKLLPTVHSRVQLLEILPVSQTQSNELLDLLHVTEPTKRTQLLYMADGLPAEISRLVADDEYFTHASQIVRDARDLLQGSSYQKLTVAHKYKDNRPDCLRLIEVAMNMVHRSLTTGPQATHTKQLDQLLGAYDAVAANGNIRLQLAAAML